MRRRALAILVAVTFLTACEKPAPDEGTTATQPGSEPAAVTDTGAHANMDMPGDSTEAPTMSSMDHSKMATSPTAGTPAPPMAGMDHSKMQTPTSRGAGGMTAMDHSRMGRSPSPRRQPSASDMSAMDHARMGQQSTGAQRAAPSSAGQQMPSMDHAAMGRMAPSSSGTTASEDAAFEKLRILIVELMRDPAIQARIQRDTALRRLWSDEQVRRAFDPRN
jgi:hypothetical protein